MIIIGLTGSIGMGKSTVAGMFRDLGAVIWDADAAVTRLYAKGGAGVSPVSARFPEAIVDGAVDKTLLSKAVIGDAAALRDLEIIVHPLVAKDRADAMAAAEKAGAPAMVLDIPLLFETGGDAACDVVVVVSAPATIQRKRVLSRPGMSEEKFDAILAKQTPDSDKRDRADHVVSTAGPLSETRDAVSNVWRAILETAKTS
ncbi:MAG: dephospho-CoA kinase [Pseudomonadota bacterium]